MFLFFSLPVNTRACGLRNGSGQASKHWAICYANSVFQLCARIFNRWEFSLTVDDENSRAIKFRKFLTLMTESTRAWESAKPLLKEIQKDHAQFVIGIQQGAYNFMDTLLGGLAVINFLMLFKLKNTRTSSVSPVVINSMQTNLCHLEDCVCLLAFRSTLKS